MRLKTKIERVIEAIAALDTSGSDLIHLGAHAEGLELRAAGHSQGMSLVIEGECLVHSPTHKTAIREILQLLGRALTTWRTMKDPKTSSQIILDITEDTLEAFPLGSPTFALRLPIHRRIGPETLSPEWDTGALMAISQDALAQMKRFWSRSSSRYPEREITHLEMRHGFLHALSTDGNKMREHYLMVGGKEPFTGEVSNAFLTRFLASPLAQEELVEMRRHHDLLSFRQDGIEMMTEIHDVPELAQVSAYFSHSISFLLAQIDRASLRQVLERIVSNKLTYVKLSLPSGEVQSIHPEHLHRRAPIPGQPDEDKAVRVRACVAVIKDASEESTSLILQASNLLEAIQAIDTEEPIHLWGIGDSQSDYLAVSGVEEFPRFILPIYE